MSSYQSLIVPDAVSCTVYEIQPSIGPLLLYFAAPLAFNAPTEGSSWDDLRKILHGGQRVAKVQNGEEIFRKFQSLE